MKLTLNELRKCIRSVIRETRDASSLTASDVIDRFGDSFSDPSILDNLATDAGYDDLSGSLPDDFDAVFSFSCTPSGALTATDKRTGKQFFMDEPDDPDLDAKRYRNGKY